MKLNNEDKKDFLYMYVANGLVCQGTYYQMYAKYFLDKIGLGDEAEQLYKTVRKFIDEQIDTIIDSKDT
jgi:hypothetical protein